MSVAHDHRLFGRVSDHAGVGAHLALCYFPDPTDFTQIDSVLSGKKGVFASAVSHFVLSTIVLGAIPLAVIARQTRSAMLEVLGEDYICTARAKGMSSRRINGIHALRNAHSRHHGEPNARKERIKLLGDVPSPLAVPDGCAVAPRCWTAQARCRREVPVLDDARHGAACFFPETA